GQWIISVAAYQLFKGRPILRPRVAQESEEGGARAGFDALTFGEQSPHVARQRQSLAVGPLKAHRRVNREQPHVIAQPASRRLEEPLEDPRVVEQRGAGVETKAVALDQVGSATDTLVRLVDRHLITGQAQVNRGAQAAHAAADNDEGGGRRRGAWRGL